MSDLEFWANVLRINNFRGVFMRQALPSKPYKNECGIINLGDLMSGGTHWTCYIKNGKRVVYFDSFGEAPPPTELEKYLNMDKGIFYNCDRYQDYNDPPICGHLCLEVLRRYSDGQDYNEIECALRKNKYVWLTWFK